MGRMEDGRGEERVVVKDDGIKGAWEGRGRWEGIERGIGGEWKGRVRALDWERDGKDKGMGRIKEWEE